MRGAGMRSAIGTAETRMCATGCWRLKHADYENDASSALNTYMYVEK